MQKRSLLIYIFLGLSIFLIPNKVLAQNEICNIEIKVNDSDTGKSITDFSLQAVNIDKQTLYKPSFENNSLLENVSIGNVNLTVEKEGYSTEYKRLKHECDSENGRIVEIKLSKRQSGKTKGIFLISSKEGSIESKAINSGAVTLGRPTYPIAARATKASGSVEVQVVIDLDGNVIYAKAIKGHPLLRSVSEKAAVESKFRPTLLEGKPVMVSGVIVYNFTP